eukprot:298744-Amphidinium_carterae.1
MRIDGVMKDVIIEGSKPGYFKNTLTQAGMESGSAVGTAGVKLATASGDSVPLPDTSTCSRAPPETHVILNIHQGGSWAAPHVLCLSNKVMRLHTCDKSSHDGTPSPHNRQNHQE